ncbi:MAG: hypothetical protein J5I41_09695 [Saprospiraceae bacterium]|nr:hypothetical protein [Saprospiraceae bacterium]
MKKGFKILRSAALLGLVLLATSCNRGNGCPNNFKVTEGLEAALQSVIAMLF